PRRYTRKNEFHPLERVGRKDAAPDNPIVPYDLHFALCQRTQFPVQTDVSGAATVDESYRRVTGTPSPRIRAERFLIVPLRSVVDHELQPLPEIERSVRERVLVPVLKTETRQRRLVGSRGLPVAVDEQDVRIVPADERIEAQVLGLRVDRADRQRFDELVTVGSAEIGHKRKIG